MAPMLLWGAQHCTQGDQQVRSHHSRRLAWQGRLSYCASCWAAPKLSERHSSPTQAPPCCLLRLRKRTAHSGLSGLPPYMQLCKCHR